MKILFLHGAIKNAGDFLISHCSQKLVKTIVPRCELIPVWEGEREAIIRGLFPKVNGVIFGGGPLFTHNIYPADIPFVSDLNSVDLPMINIGGGWYGKNNSYKSVSRYHIDNSSLKLLRKIEKSSGCLSCRDWLTVNMLKEKGFKAEMHGCPAWYDLENVEKSHLRDIAGIKKICISDPADIKNYGAAIQLINLLKKRYTQAEIQFIFHRGAWGKEEGILGIKRKTAIENILIKNQISCVDISGGYEGFSVYDSCDLHIGFKVHAHIYNLSKRNRTVLLEEDGRGAGVNNVLGLNNIHVYDESRQNKIDLIRKIENRIQPKINTYFEQEVIRTMERVEYTDWLEYDLAFSRMQFYYEQMKKHIIKIENW